MMSDLSRAREVLKNGRYTCVICKNERLYTSDFRGVKPLASWYSKGLAFEGFSAADKVVGRATAFLYALFKVKALYANVISKPALEVLRNNNIEVSYDTLADNIINRTGDGICPFEKAVLGIDDMYEAYRVIRLKMKDMNIDL